MKTYYRQRKSVSAGANDPPCKHDCGNGIAWRDIMTQATDIGALSRSWF